MGLPRAVESEFGVPVTHVEAPVNMDRGALSLAALSSGQVVLRHRRG